MIFAQFRASAVKALLAVDDLPSTTTIGTSSSTAAVTATTAGGDIASASGVQNKSHSIRDTGRSDRLPVGKSAPQPSTKTAAVVVANTTTVAPSTSATTTTAAVHNGLQCKSIIDIMAEGK